MIHPGKTTLAALLLLAGCASELDPANDLGFDTSLYALVETIDGTSFYPPLGPTPSPSGSFDATLLPELQVALDATDALGATQTIATFHAGSNPALRLVAAHEVYFVNVPAAAYLTDPALAYSFRITLGDRQLGRSDLAAIVFDVLTRYPSLMIGVMARIELRAAPVLSAITPDTVLAGATNTSVLLEGSSFSRDSIARFAGQDLDTNFISSGALEVAIPDQSIASPGVYAVEVFTPRPGGGTSASLDFTAANPAPALTSISPDHARPGDPTLVLSVIGSGFVSASTVIFGGHPLATTLISPTEVSAVVPASLISAAATFVVRVVNPFPGGGESGAASFVVPGLTLSDGLIASYDFEEASGAALDHSGNGNNLTLNGATRLAPGTGAAPHSRGVSCSAAGQTLTALASTSLRSAREQLTIAGWIRPTTVTGNPGIVSLAARGGPAQNWGFYLRNGELGIFTNFPSRSSNVYDSTTSGANIRAGEWAHVAVVIDYLARTSTYYKNGARLSSHPHNLPLDQLTLPLTFCSEGGAIQDYTGSLDDFAIWNRALTDEELEEVASDLSLSHPAVLDSGRTCREIYDSGRSRGNGLYALDPDGLGGLAPILAQCDMTTDGGGWTLVANQVGTQLISSITSDDINPQNDGLLTSTFRLGNTRIQAFVPQVAWRIRAVGAMGQIVDQGYTRPQCVINWLRMVGIRTSDCTSHSQVELVSALDTNCGILYTGTSFTTLVSNYTTANCALGIGQNNSGAYCSMRMSSVGWGAVPPGGALPCNVSQTSAVTMQLWAK